jgi:hypothetical protein
MNQKPEQRQRQHFGERGAGSKMRGGMSVKGGNAKIRIAVGYQEERTPQAYAGRCYRQHPKESTMRPKPKSYVPHKSATMQHHTRHRHCCAVLNHWIRSLVWRSCRQAILRSDCEGVSPALLCIQMNLRHHKTWDLKLHAALPSFVQCESSPWSSATYSLSMNSLFLDVATQI